MVDLDSPSRHHGSSPHLREDQDLLKELFERHHFVKSNMRFEANLIQTMPSLSQADKSSRKTFFITRRNNPNKRPIQLPGEAR